MEPQPLVPEVKILGFIYAVRYNPELADEGLLGRILFLRSVIELRPGMSPAMEMQTLRHETWHGYWFHSGFKEHDEHLLDVTANCSKLMHQENPQLVPG